MTTDPNDLAATADDLAAWQQAALHRLEGDMIFLSMQDMFGYLRAHPTMSGIQRVQAGLALYAINHGEEDVGFLVNDVGATARHDEFLLVRNEDFARVIAYASGERVNHDHLRALMDRAMARAVAFRPKRGHTIIIPGSFWGHGNTLDRYLAARRDGVLIGAYIHDIIPITHPEHCVPELVRDFTLAFCELPLVVDFMFTVSDYTQQSVRSFLRRNGGRDIPIRTVPLAHAMTIPHARAGSWPDALRALRRRPYVVYVSTIEGRKNHFYVASAWRELIQQGVDMPHLVFVGRKGWRIGGLVDLLDGTDNLGGRVHIVHDLTDAELDSVYANCLFTVFTSFVEGWGLPVSESLLHRVPCVASNTSSIPQVGGDFIDYVDPLNLRQGMEVLRRMIEDDDYRASRRRHIETDFVPRSWDEVGRDFLVATREAIAAHHTERPLYPRLARGRKFAPGELVVSPIALAAYIASPMRLTVLESFYQIEPFGAWMRGTAGGLTFATDLAEGNAVLVYLTIDVPDRGIGRELQLLLEPGTPADDLPPAATPGTRAAPPPEADTYLLAGGRRTYRMRGRVGRDGLITVTITVSGKAEAIGPDSRAFVLGMHAIGYVADGDPLAREDLLEQFAFADLTPTG